MRVLNVRLLAILLACLTVFSSAVYFLHGFQVRQNAHVFLQQAEHAEQRAEEAEQQDDQKAAQLERINTIRNLGWYVKLVPNDVDALQKLGMMLSKLEHYSQALSVLEGVLRQDPKRSDVRREVVNIAITMLRFHDAQVHLEEYLLEENPNDAELLELLGRCQAAMRENANALRSFDKAIEQDPNRVDVYPRLAGVLRSRLNRDNDADQVMKQMIQANPESYRAHLLMGQYLRSTDKTDEAMEHAMKALEIDPDDRDALWLTARCAMGQEDYEQARKYARHGIELFPEHVPMYTTLADIELRTNQRDKAIYALQEGLNATDDHPQLLWSMANLLIDARRIEKADEITGKLQDFNYPDALVGYLKARIDFIQSRWLTASQGFERVRPGLTAWPDLVKQADFWLGKCYGALGNTDQQIAAYRRSVDADQFFAPARAGIAEALLRAGRVTDAMVEYRQLMRMGKAADGGALPWARMLIIRNLRMESSKRNWEQVETALDEAERITPDSYQIPILRAEVLIAQDRIKDAETLITDARDKKPEEVEFWTVLASLAERQEDWLRAEQILSEAEKRLGNRIELRIARARYLARHHGKETVEQLHALAENTEKFSDTEHVRLWKGLLGAALQVNDVEQIKKLCRKVSEAEPNNVQIQFLLFELALRAEDEQAMDETLKSIQEIEQGPLWLFGQAVRLSLQANKNNDKKLLDKALKLLRQARELRPSWSRIPLLAAGIYDQQGNHSKALESYLAAINMGERNPGAVRRAIQLLYREQRFLEARRLLNQFEDIPPELLGMARDVDLRLGNFQEALDSARKAATDSDDYRNYIWLGQILSLMGQQTKAGGRTEESAKMFEEAEKALRRATELNGEIASTWVALIQFLSSTDRQQEAEKAIDLAQTKISKDRFAVAMAQCYEAMGKLDLAKEKYEAALKADPTSLPVVRTVADFYLRAGQSESAEGQLNRIIAGIVPAKPTDILWARRRLALLLASQGGYQNRQKAIDLVRENLKVAGTSLLDHRVLANLLAQNPTYAQRKEAIKIFEGLLKAQRTPTPEDQFILAQLYLAENSWVKASDMMLQLLASRGNEPRYVTAYVRALLTRDDFGGTELWLSRLERIVPNIFQTVSLRAELLFQRKQYNETIDVLRSFIENPDAQPSDEAVRMRLAAARLEEFAGRLTGPKQVTFSTRFSTEAERLHRKYVVDRPDEKLRLAAFLGRNGQVDEATGIIEDNWENGNPLALAQSCVALMKDTSASQAQHQRVEKVVQNAMDKFDRHNALLLMMADVRTTQKRYTDAEKFYREIIKANKRDAVAMNNLAVLLGLRKTKLGEALKLINRAMAIAGPVGPMLDSRATVYMARAEPEKAIADLDRAIAEAATPVRLFHLAQAHQQAGRKQDAVEAMKKADSLGLKPKQLQPLELPIYDKLKKLL